MKTRIAEIVCEILKEKQWGIFFKNEPMQSLPVQDNTALYKINEVKKDDRMAKSSGPRKGKSDRQRIIEWYKSDLDRYRLILGEETEFGTLVTEELIKQTEDRISELELKEKKWEVTISELMK